MTVKHTLVSLDMRVFALCSLMELHRGGEGKVLVTEGIDHKIPQPAQSPVFGQQCQREKQMPGVDHQAQHKGLQWIKGRCQ